MEAERARRARAVSQLFGLGIRSRPGSVPDTVREMVALQAQDLMSASLQVRARSRGLTHDDFTRALFEERSIVRTWSLRGTLHVVDSRDLRWILPIVRPRALKKLTRRDAELGIDQRKLDRAEAIVGHALEGGRALPRSDLFEKMSARGINTRGQAGIHILWNLGMQGLICYGPHAGGNESFVLLDEWLEPSPRTHVRDASSELARRYIMSSGPSGIEDLSWWSGLGASECRRALDAPSSDIRAVEIGGSHMWIHSDMAKWRGRGARPDRRAHLLPAFDAYILAYKDRSLAIADEDVRKVNTGGGLIRPVVVVDGRVVGRWKMSKTARSASIAVELFGERDNPSREALEKEASDLGRYLGSQVQVSIVP